MLRVALKLAYCAACTALVLAGTFARAPLPHLVRLMMRLNECVLVLALALALAHQTSVLVRVVAHCVRLALAAGARRRVLRALSRAAAAAAA